MPGIYGPVVTLDRVEDAIETVIAAWIDTYLGVVERASGLATRSIRRPDAPSGYQFEGDVRAAPAGAFPIVQISTPGEVSDPTVEMGGALGERIVTGTVAFAVRAFVHSGEGRRATTRLKHRWATALAMVIEQKAGDPATSPLPGLGAQVIVPVVQVPADVLPSEGQDRWLGVAQVGFLVLVEGMRQLSGGPAAPDQPAPTPLPSTDPDDPAHASTNVTVTGHMP